jgi:hypothetical protein
MFLRLQRAYYQWRINLLDAKIRGALREQVQAEFEHDALTAADCQIYLDRLYNDKRYFTYQLCRLPQPT